MELLETTGVTHPTFWIDKILKTELMTTFLTKELKEYVSKTVQPKEDSKFVFDRSIKIRLQTLALLFFSGSYNAKLVENLGVFIRFILENAECHKLLECFGDTLSHKHFLQPHNCIIFFDGLAEASKGFEIKDDLITPTFVDIYLSEVTKCLSGFGRKTSFTQDIAKGEQSSFRNIKIAKDKVGNSLWSFALWRKFSQKDSSLKVERLVVEHEFGTLEGIVRISPVESVKKSWDRVREITLLCIERAKTLPEIERGVGLGNLAGIWTQALVSAKGPEYIGSEKASLETVTIMAVGLVPDIRKLQADRTLAKPYLFPRTHHCAC